MIFQGDLEFDVYAWRNAIASPAGPRLPSTRHVLLTLSLHMDRNGVAWPSQKKLAERTGLALRTVNACLNKAVAGGWIVRVRKERPGQAWFRHEYLAAIPADFDLAMKPWEADPGWKRDKPAKSSDTVVSAAFARPSRGATCNVVQSTQNVVQPATEGSATIAPDVVQQLHTNYSSEQLTEQSSNKVRIASDATVRVNDTKEKEPKSSGQSRRTLSPFADDSSLSNDPDSLRKIGGPDTRPKGNLDTPIRKLLEAGQQPGDVQRILATRGCTLDHVYAVLAAPQARSA